VYLPNGLCGGRVLCSTYLAHVGDDKAKMNKGYVRICRCGGDAWLCSQSLDFWASPGTTRACCSCPTHVNCVLQRHERPNGGTKGKEERNRPKFAHKTVPGQSTTHLKPFATSDILNTTEMGRGTESLLRSHRCDEKWKIRIFLAHVCQGLSSFRHMGLFSFRFIGIRDPWIEC